MGRTALLACPEGGTNLSAMAGLDRSSFNTEPGLRSISFSIFQSLIPAHFCVGFFIFCLACFLRRAVRDGENAAVLFLSLFFYFPFGSVCGILCALQEIAVN